MNTHKVIDLSNSAVASLQQGRHKQAVTLLRTAITEFKDHFVVRTQGPRFSESSVNMHPDATASSAITPCNGEDGDYGLASSIKVSQKQDKPAIQSVPIWTEESFAQKHDKTLIFMYGQALVLARVDHCKETLIAVVLYNMALANHALAIEKDAFSLLTVALKFYGKAVAILQGQNDFNVNASNTSNYWMLLALYNNMAQIYFSQACSEKLRQCIGSMQTLLAAETMAHGINDCAFFLRNVMLELRVITAPAA
jgi:hypothetical protein